MPSFALIAEGVTDQQVMERLLIALCDSKDDVVVNYLQSPNRTDPGNWDKVLKYCASARFRGAFQSNDFVVIQIDSDISDRFIPPISHAIDGEEVAHDILIEQICNHLAAEIDRDAPGYFEQRKDRIVFAIAVHSIECCFLPLIYADSRKTKTDNCLNALNTKLQPRKFTIDKQKKQPGYDRLFREPELRKLKRGEVLEISRHNSGFARFVAQVNSITRAIASDSEEIFGEVDTP